MSDFRFAIRAFASQILALAEPFDVPAHFTTHIRREKAYQEWPITRHFV